MPRRRRDEEEVFALEGLSDGSDDRGDHDDEFPDEEVFALQGVSSDDDDDQYAEYPEDTGASDRMDVDSDADSDTAVPVAKSKRKSSKTARDSKKSSSKEHASDSEEEEEEETWGNSKSAYYASNAAQIDSEDEETNELEVQEALRLQAKAREGMCDEDFGLGDVVEGDVDQPEAIEQDLPNPPPTKVPQDKQSILRTLEKESPESLALARDWDDIAHNLVEAKARVDALEDDPSNALELGLQHIYYQAMLTYATTLAFYLHLRATDKYAARPQLLRRHPILKRLLTLKEGIHTLENLGVGQDASDEDEDGEDEEGLLTDGDDEDGDLWSLIKNNGLESGELADLLEDAGMSMPSSPSPSPPPPSKKAKETKKEREQADTRRKKKKRKTPAAIRDSDPGTQGPVFDLLEPEYTRRPVRKNKVALVDTAAADPYGEASALQYHDLSDKRARKKSLRFHVSRIEASSSRRTNARANAFGGDNDIPYKERKKEREARSEKEKDSKKAKGQLGAGGDDLDDADPQVGEGKKRKRKRGLDDEDAADDAGGADGYYDLVKRAAATKKARKKAEYEAATVRPELELDNTSGPRGVTRAILKNKGLTPRRAKAVRNPRVKKRQRFEQAKKKVASQKAVYKGGIGDVSKYSGEQSGISKVVKSVRL